MDATRFSQLMAQLTATVGKPFSADEIAAWYAHLQDIPADALEVAFGRACKECEAFPSVAMIRRFAADAQHGTQSGIPDVWPKVLEAVKYFGHYKKSEARKALPANVWKSLGGDVGWDWLCEATPDQRASMRAQFRDSYRELREREQRDRRLPESLRPKINNTPVAGLPEPKPEQLALPAPPQPSADQVAAAKLRVFRDAPEPAAVIDDSAIESRRQNQIAALKQMGAAS